MIRVCSEPGCPELTENGKCEEHRKAARARRDARRESAADRGYGACWRKIRTAFLAEHPICIDCGGDAVVPDHDPKTRRELVAEGVDDPDDFKYLKPRCTTCHNRKTAKDKARGR